MQEIGKAIVAFGASLLLLGLILWLFGSRLAWLGRLPGDIRTDTVFIPITTCIVVSIVLTILLNVLARIFWR